MVDAVFVRCTVIQAKGVVIDPDVVPISIDDEVVVSAKVYPSIVTTDVTVEAAEIISVSIVD